MSSTAPSAHPVIQRFFDVSLYLLLATSFAMLAGTGRLDVLSSLLGVLTLGAKGFLLARQKEAQIPERWTTYLTFLYIAFFALDYFVISQAFLAAVIHIVLLLAFLKLFSIHRDRDYLYLALLAFGMVLTAAVLTVDSLFFGFFCVFVLLAVMTFVSMEMRRSWNKAYDSQSDIRSHRDLRRLPASISRIAVSLVLSIVVGTVVLFFLLPRKTSSGYLGEFAAHNDLSTGFSEEVQLGSIGQIQQSNTVVMHVKFAPGAQIPGDLHWRGVALRNFDGHSWKTSQVEGTTQTNRSGTFFTKSSSPRLFSGRGKQISYRVSLEPFGARVFFVLPQALLVRGRYQSVRVDSSGSLFNADPLRSVTDYDVLSEIPPGMPPSLPDAIGVDVSDEYLEVPPDLDPQVARLAQDITKNQTTQFLKASEIEHYLSTTYRYTLQLPQVSPRDPIADFLFRRREGHCEYFASSMAIMLRTLRIPSRIVNGFHGGEYNDVTDSYIIRAKDAHSWVEAYFPGYGWYTFDPTPASAEPPSAWNRLYLYADAMSQFWHEWVVNYDTGHQVTLGFAVVRQSHSQFEHTRTWLDFIYQSCLRKVNAARERFHDHANIWAVWMSIGFSLVMALLIGPKLFSFLRDRRFSRKPALKPHSAATIWYRRMLKLLSKRGIRKSPAQTPQEFIQSVSVVAVKRQLAEFTVHYEKARFGDSAPDAEKLPELYRELELVSKK